MATPFELTREQWIPAPIDEVFDFFSNARNLGALTPDHLKFQILTLGDIQMEAGTLIDYQISLYGVPFKWQTRIDLFEPGHRFIDRQLVGPYKSWVHEHRFLPVDGGTLVIDHVRYEVPLGRLGQWFHPWFVRRNLDEIFDYRRAALESRFGPRALAA